MVVDSNHRPDERIAPALDVRDVPVSEFAVPKRLSDRCNVYAEASLFDHDVRPDVINQLFLCDDLAGTLSKIDQNIERPAAELNGLPVIEEKPPMSDSFSESSSTGWGSPTCSSPSKASSSA